MSLSTQALVLIRLKELPDQAVSVDALAAHYAMPTDQVRQALQALWDAGRAMCVLRADGLITQAVATITPASSCD